MNRMKFLLCPLLLCASLCQAALCDSGKRQSPINIDTKNLSTQKIPELVTNYRPAPLRLANDGHTLRVRFDKGSQLTIGKENYTLQQFHFHTPGGEQINGEVFPFGAHILHKHASGQLLAMTVPFRIGSENALLSTLLPLIPKRIDGDHKHPQVSVNVRDLLPSKLGYYRYSGSLTDAPCTENVEWIVLKQPLELSATQLAQWRKHFAENMRTVSPLYQRTVFATP